MSKTFLPITAIALVVILGALIFLKGFSSPSNPSASPSPSSTLASTSPSSTSRISPSATVDPYVGWRTYSNTDFGFSFRYPSEWGDVTVTHKNGDTGTVFSGKFSSNDLLTFAGQTTDYTVGIGAGFTNFSGCTKNADGTYACQFAQGKTRTVTPSEVLTTADGKAALILFGVDISQILSSTTRGAYVNLSGTTYPGIAFQYLNIPATNATTFDNMIRSIKSL